MRTPLPLAFVSVAFVSLLAWLGACAASAPAPEGWRDRLAQAPEPPADNAFPMPPDELEALMREVDFEITDVEPTQSGVMGALRMEAYYPAAKRTLAFKWKPAPEGLEGWNNTPRREVAAYQLQKWFLDAQDYVVPTTLAVCIPLAVYSVESEPEPNVPGARCVFGTQTIWLEDVIETDTLFDEARFYGDPVYARHLAHYNLLTYLIQNRDTRSSNFLVSEDPANPRVYSVDNGITFGEWLFNFFIPHWDRIRVPALPRGAIERLRQVSAEDVAALAVVAQLRPDPHGVLRETSPSAPFDPDEGVRLRDGTVQLGLVTDEIEAVRRRLANLLRDVDEGEIPVF